MVSCVFQWAKSILIIIDFDAQIVPDLLDLLFLLLCPFDLPHHSLIILFWKKMFQAHLVLFLPKPEMSHLTKVSQSHLVEIGI